MKVIKSNNSGRYFVEGKGFVANSAKEATRIDCNEVAEVQSCAKAMGLGSSTAEDVTNRSYGVVYIRKADVTAAGNIDKKAPRAALAEVDPSRRRFATEQEAITHGSRFNVRRANRRDNPGTAGHRGFYLVETNDPVNASVNPETGLTNQA